jgi:hypothetical protein
MRQPTEPSIVKIPPRVMFLTQVYGTVLGGFVNYAVMISIVTGNRELLTETDGNSSWSGATIQSYNTNATSWALAKYLYKAGARYQLVPYGILFGAGCVAIHRVIAYVSLAHLSLQFSPLTECRSSIPKSRASLSTRSTCPNSSSSPATSHTTNRRPASS